MEPRGLHCQVPLSMGLPRQEYWSGLTFLTPGDLPNPGIEPTSPVSPTLQMDSLQLEPPTVLNKLLVVLIPNTVV